MPVTITLTDEQEARARALVEAGAYPDIEAVIGASFDALQVDHDATPEMDIGALRALLEDRMKGPFISMEESERRMKAMFARKRREYGLSD